MSPAVRRVQFAANILGTSTVICLFLMINGLVDFRIVLILCAIWMLTGFVEAYVYERAAQREQKRHEAEMNAIRNGTWRPDADYTR